MADAGVLRVVQWTTGYVAVEVVKELVRRTDIELVGAYAYSLDKVGVDVGMLCGTGESLGVCATNEVDALLALQPDCVVYTPLHFDVAEVVRILRTGVNIVTSAEFLTGRNLTDTDRAAVDDAAQHGGASATRR